LFAVLAGAENQGKKWDPAAFFATGQFEVEKLFERLVRDGQKACFERALDFGCGVGRLSEALASRCTTVSAVDVSEVMVAKAREFSTHGNVDYIVNSAPDLRIFPDRFFDLCVSHLVLQHVGRRLAVAYLREIVRVLAPGGVAEVEVPVGFRNFRGVLAAILPNMVLRVRSLWRRGMFFTTTYPIRPQRVEGLISEGGARVIESQVLYIHPSSTIRSYVFTKLPTETR
jgi:SAM-dependent methyltransferase